jgi:hypothetical protein
VLQSYCDTSFLRGGVIQMWILKNSKDLLEYIQSPRHLCNLRIQESGGRLSSSSLVEIPNRPTIVQDFLFRKCRRVYVGLASELSIPNSFGYGQVII